MSVQDKVIGLISERSLIKDSVAETMRLREDLGIDSLRLVEIVLTLEDSFDVAFGEDDLAPDNFSSVSDMIRLVEKYI